MLNKHLDMGQGNATGLATLVAEELDAAPEQMRAEFAPADTGRYKNLAFGMQGTGGSTAIANSFEQYRKAGATARAMLVAAAAKARRHLYVIARTDAAASEGLDGAVARAKLYMEAGADAIFPEALNSAEMFREFAKRMPGVPLLANMTEFGRTPFFTAREFEEMGYRMVIWPVSSLRVANKAQEKLYATLKQNGSTEAMAGEMQTRAELYDTIGLAKYEALDASIVATVLPS